MLDPVQTSGGHWHNYYSQALLCAAGQLPFTERRGLLLFLEWLTTRPAKSRASRIRSSFCARSGANARAAFPDDASCSRVLVDTIYEWRDEILLSKSILKKTTLAKYIRGALRALEILKDRGLPGIPRNWNSRWVNVGGWKVGRSTATLGAAKWPELEPYKGMEREQHAIHLVRTSAVRLFIEYERLFVAGQSILAGTAPPHGKPEACSAIRTNLLQLREIVRNTGRFSLTWEHTKDGQWARNPETWRDGAGIDISGIWAKDIRSMPYRGCLGPLAPCVRALAVVLACDTGWNMQSIQDLARDPFVFRSSTKAYIAERSFIQSFKNRAGAYVLGFLGEQIFSGDKLHVLEDYWGRLTRSDYSDFATYVLTNEPGNIGDVSSIDLLLRYKKMADALRSLLGDGFEPKDIDSFWIYIDDHSEPKVGAPQQLLANRRYTDKQNFLTRRETTFRSIRKTFAVIKRQETGSFAATRTALQQTSTSILMPHYWNTPHVANELDQEIRRYQDSLEAVIVRERDQETVSWRLGKPAGDLTQLRSLAERSGITAALGLLEEGSLGQSSARFYFCPNQDNLYEIYLVHRKLREMQTNYSNRERFRREYLPLLALVKAIGREFCRKGHGRRYRAAARRAAFAVRSGLDALPHLED